MPLKHKTHNRAPVAVVQRQTQITREQLSRPAHVLQRTTAKLRAALRPADILVLQQTVGNRVVQRMLQRTDEDKPLKGHSLGRRETGLPDGLKSGVESLSGISMDDVRVHYNSAKPAGVHARAYTQGTNIYLGPNEEEHLPHEAWHVVQQRQGRVRPTTILAKGLPANDDAALEREADVMGNKALRITGIPYREQKTKPVIHFTAGQPIQRVEDTIDKKVEMWSWLEQHLGQKGEIPQWRETTFAGFWPLVEAKVETLITKIVTAQMALNSFESYMLRPTPTLAGVQVNALVSSAPVIPDSPVIATTDDATKLAGLKNKLNWISRKRPALRAELKRKKADLSLAQQWQIYGEAIAETHNSKHKKDASWGKSATEVAVEIEKAGIGAAVDLWLDNVITRIATLNRLWEEGTRTITGTFGTLRSPTIKKLFRDYPAVTLAILTRAVNQTVSDSGWEGVKYLSAHRRYARELKIRSMGGDYRVFSLKADPATLTRIGSIH